MPNKTLFFVTGCDPKKAPAFETGIKALFLNSETKEKNPCLSFAHNLDPHLTGDKVKGKKPHLIIIDSTVSVEKTIGTVKAIKKRLNGSTPLILNLGMDIAVTDVHVKNVKTQNDVLELFIALSA